MSEPTLSITEQNTKLADQIRERMIALEETGICIDEPETVELGEKIVEDLMAMFEIEYGNLSEKVIGDHQSNLIFYLREYGVYREGALFDEMLTNETFLDYFYGDWYISHAMWSTAASTKKNMTSLKKLAKMLRKYDLLSAKEEQELKSIIKENLEEWLIRVNLFNSGQAGYREYAMRVHGFDPGDFF